MKLRTCLATLAASAALLGLGSTAQAAVCIGPGGGGSNVVYGSIPQASACVGMFSGNLTEGTLFGDYDYLAKATPDENGGAPINTGPFAGAVTITVANDGLSGTWTIHLNLLGGNYNEFWVGLKPDGGYGYFYVANTLTGTWNTDSSNIDPCELPEVNANNARMRPQAPPTEPRFNCAGFALSHLNLYGRYNPDFDNDVPEPGSLALLGIAALGLAASRRKRT